MKSKQYFWHVVYRNGAEGFEANGDIIRLKEPMRIIEWIPDDASEKSITFLVEDGDEPVILKRNYAFSNGQPGVRCYIIGVKRDGKYDLRYISPITGTVERAQSLEFQNAFERVALSKGS